MAKAAVARRADGLMIEVHCRKEEALSDGAQSLTPGREFPAADGGAEGAVVEAVGRKEQCASGGLSLWGNIFTAAAFRTKVVGGSFGLSLEAQGIPGHRTRYI